MTQNVIALVCDCDSTLCPDTTHRLLSELGIEVNAFWREVSDMVEGGWDAPLAYLTKLLDLSRERKIGLSRRKLTAVGRGIKFYPGVLGFVVRLQGRLQQNVDYREAGVRIEWYIVSSGIEEVIRASRLGRVATEIFGCAFDYNDRGEAVRVKRTVTFTEKTKFVFAVNKGISGDELRRKPYRVNDAVEKTERRVPIEHMVYIGDGPSDIPCFSLIKNSGGHAIGVMPPEDVELRKPYELAQGRRLTVGPYTADYREGSDLFKMLLRIVEGIADSMVEKRAHKIRPAPSY